MLKFMRNKIVRIFKKEDDLLHISGLLTDDIYELELRVVIRPPELEIISVDGQWNRWTTPECPRAIPMLQEAVGMKATEQGFSDKMKKLVGRKSCRHFANLLLECCHAAKEASLSMQWQTQKPDQESRQETPTVGATSSGKIQEISPRSQSQASFKKMEKKGLCIDLHVHTSPASPCSSAPVDKLIEEAKRIGLDGICLTDHNYVWDESQVQKLRQTHDFLILRGNEITTDQGDMLVFGFYENITGIIKLEELRKKVEQAGGFIIAAHPFRGFLTFGVGQLGLTPEKAMERPLFRWVDGVEVLNSKVTEKENAFSLEVANRLNLPTTGGSDAHEVEEVGIYATCFEINIQDENDLVTALKSTKYTPVAFRKTRKEQAK